MFNLWPHLFTYTQVMPLLFRITLALLLALSAARLVQAWGWAPLFLRLRAPVALWAARVVLSLELCLAILLVVGAWTQLAGLLTALLFLKLGVLHRYFPALAPYPASTYHVAAVMAAALVVWGAGLWGIDYPGGI